MALDHQGDYRTQREAIWPRPGDIALRVGQEERNRGLVPAHRARSRIDAPAGVLPIAPSTYREHAVSRPTRPVHQATSGVMRGWVGRSANLFETTVRSAARPTTRPAAQNLTQLTPAGMLPGSAGLARHPARRRSQSQALAQEKGLMWELVPLDRCDAGETRTPFLVHA